MVGRRNAGWTTSKIEYPIHARTAHDGFSEKTGRGSELNHLCEHISGPYDPKILRLAFISARGCNNFYISHFRKLCA